MEYLPPATPAQIIALRNELSEMSNLLMNVQPTPELAVIRTKIREAKLWCDAHLEVVGGQPMVEPNLPPPPASVYPDPNAVPVPYYPPVPPPPGYYPQNPHPYIPPYHQVPPPMPQRTPPPPAHIPAGGRHPAVTSPRKGAGVETTPSRTPKVIDGRNHVAPKDQQDPPGMLPQDFGRDPPPGQYGEPDMQPMDL